MYKTFALRAAFVGAALMVALMAPGGAGAQQPDHCLNNSGDFNVDAGVQYADANGAWVCAPGSVSATAGGWVRLEGPAPAPSRTSTSPTVATNKISDENDDKDGGIGFMAFPSMAVLIGTIVVAMLAVIGVVVAIRLRSGPRLTGTVKLEEVRRGQR